MTTNITDKEYNETMRIVANYLSWEEDVRNIESVMSLWGHFQEAVRNGEPEFDWKASKYLLMNVVERNAA